MSKQESFLNLPQAVAANSKKSDNNNIHFRTDESVSNKHVGAISSYSVSDKSSNNNNVSGSLSKLGKPASVLSDDFLQKKRSVLEEIHKHHKQGIDHFHQGELELAEQELVQAMKPVLSKPAMQSLNVNVDDCKEQMLDAIYHLGQIYLKSKKYLDNYSKAAAIFQYCAGFAKKHDVATKINFLQEAYATEGKFLENISIKDRTKSNIEYQEKINYYKSELKGIRKLAGERLKKIEDLISIGHIAERAKEVEDIYSQCTRFFVNHGDNNNNQEKLGLIQKLLQECYRQLGPVPEGFEYSIIGLGSLAGGKMTPWSDLEFGILINQDEEKYKEYFRNLTKLLHIKIINLEETPLRSVGIESLNNFRTANKADDWFWDEVTNNGFSFDGADWHACKLPLGRQGGYKAEEKVKNKDGIEKTKIVVKPDYELILTPQQMAEFQSEKLVTNNEEGKQEIGETVQDSWYSSGKHLVQALKSVCLIDGSQRLLDEYRGKAREAVDIKIIQKRVLEILSEDIDSFSLKLGDKEEGKLFDVKKGIYRVADRVIEALANYYGIETEEGQPSLSVWQVIDKMAEKDIVSKEGAQHLKEAISIATELRLATYCHNQGQKEGVSAYVPAVEHLTEQHKKQILEETFFVKDTAILHHFYYVMLRLQGLIKAFYSEKTHNQAQIELKSDLLFDQSNYIKGMIYARFLEYAKALKYLEAAEQENPQDIYLLNDLFFLQRKLGCIESAVVMAKKKLALAEDGQPSELHLIIIADNYHHLGDAYRSKGEYERAIESHNKSLKIQEEVYANNPNHPDVMEDIADNHNNLGIIYYARGEYDKAVKFYHKALKIRKKISASSTHKSNPDIAGVYSNLAIIYEAKSEYDKAVEYYKKGLGTYQSIYTDNPNHPVIADSYGNLGGVYAEKGEYDVAIEYHSHSLKIFQKVYVSIPSHPNIARNYNNLGSLYEHRGEYDFAITHYNQALILLRKTYASNLNHPDIAASICGLGIVYNKKGEYDLAIKYYDQALEMWQKTYTGNLDHPYIAYIYNNLGAVYYDKGEYDQAIKYYNQALGIQKKAYAANQNHVNIANSYNNLGNAYQTKKEYELAITYHNQALKILEAVYVNTPNHPLIANSYNNLGTTYAMKGEYDRAIKYFCDALEMQRKTYTTNPYHPEIARSYGNLGGVYAEEGKYERAIEYHNQVLEIWQKVYGSKAFHPDIASSYRNLGSVYAKKGEYERAVEYYKEALEIHKKVYISSPNHLGTALISNSLEKAYKLQDIEKRLLEKFSKLKISIGCSDATMEIPTSDIITENLQIYCQSQLGIVDEDLIFSKKNCWITLNKKAIDILRDKILKNDSKKNLSSNGVGDQKLFDYWDHFSKKMLSQELVEVYSEPRLHLREIEIETQKSSNCGDRVIKNLMQHLTCHRLEHENAAMLPEDAILIADEI